MAKCNAVHVGCSLHRRLVSTHTGLWLDAGQPEQNADKFEPPPGFADSEQLLHWGAQRQQAECSVRSTPVEAVAAGQGAQVAGQGAQAAGQDAQAAGWCRGGVEAAPARPDSRQHEEQGDALEVRHLVNMLATSMTCLVRSVRSVESMSDALQRCALLPMGALARA